MSRSIKFLNVANNKKLNAVEINRYESRKSKKGPLHDLDVIGSCVWNPYLASLFDNLLTLYSESSQGYI